MKKLITMLLAMGLLALLSLGGVAYADEGGKNASDNNGKKDHKKVVICHEKDHEFKLVAVKKEELKKQLEDDAFFPKAKVIEEEKDKATVKFVCDNNGDDKDDKMTIYPFQDDNDDNGDDNGHQAAAIGMRQTALVV